MRQNGAVIRLESLLEATAPVLTWPPWPLTGFAVKESAHPARPYATLSCHLPPECGHSSYTENASGHQLGANLMSWFWQQYAPDVSPTGPNVSPPQLQEVPSLTPTLVATSTMSCAMKVLRTQRTG